MKSRGMKKIIVLCTVSLLIPALALCQDIPYRADFEEPTFSAGSLHNQDGWLVNEGAASVQTAKKYAGSQAVQINADSTVVRALDGTGLSTVWAQGYYSGAGVSGVPEIPDTPLATAIVFFSADNGIQCYDGDGSGGGTFINTGVMLSASSWHKITLKFNFSTQTWDCYVDNVLEASNLGFKDNVTQFNGFMNFSKVESHLDDFMVLPSYKGDATLDGALDIVDVIMLINHLNGDYVQTDPIILNNMDINNSGTVTSDDLTMLLNEILGK